MSHIISQISDCKFCREKQDHKKEAEGKASQKHLIKIILMFKVINTHDNMLKVETH